MSRAVMLLALALAFAAGTGVAGYRLAQYRAAQTAMTAPSAPADATAGPASEPAAARRVLYYRNPMGLPDTSPTPKKDWMGMDYIAVYEGEDQNDGSSVKVSLDRVQRIGVRIESVQRRNLVRPLRAVGTIQFDERRMYAVSTRYGGWIDKLLVNATGEQVRRGQSLMQVYSPDLLVDQQEFVALGTSGIGTSRETQSLIEAAGQRLIVLGLPASDLARLRQGGKPTNHVTVVAPHAGIVIEKPAIEGMKFAAGDLLYKLADISSVWLIAEVFERDLALVKLGQQAGAKVAAYPDRRFDGQVTFVYPNLNRETRTARVRIELPNADFALKGDMYADVEIAAAIGAGDVLAVPSSAVIDDGTRRVVLIELDEGRYEPRQVTLGAKSDDYYEVIEGLKAGERVVIAANFLIDAESNLKAALRGFANPEAPK